MNKNDSLEAIYALNIGDFLVESFISDDLLNKISDRVADDPNKLKRQLEELIDIYSMDKTLGILGFQPEDGFVIYDSIASTLTQMFQVDACHLFQAAANDIGQIYLSLSGTSLDLAGHHRWQIGAEAHENELLGRVFEHQTTTMVSDVSAMAGWKPIKELHQEKAVSLLLCPMVDLSEKGIGLLVFESYSATEFSSELVELAEATAKVLVTALQLQQCIGKAQQTVRQASPSSQEMQNLRAAITENIAELGVDQQTFVECLGAAIDARYTFSRGHSKRVAQVSKVLASELDLNEKSLDLIYLAGLVGHIGKMHIPGQVVTKQNQLNADEWDNFHSHPNVGVSLLAQINFLTDIVPYVHFQQERWDGSGSPEGRQGRNIPLGSRILALADAYQAMLEERPYRQTAMAHQEAIQALQLESGVKWDPMLVELLGKLPEVSLRS